MSLDISGETLAENLAVLAHYRTRGVRASEEVVKRGERVLQTKNALRRMRDEVWPFLEQLGFAALDIGQNDLAQICIQRLEEKFPKSPRVDALQGLLLERESPLKAKEFYQSRLAEDENNVLVRKRLIALHLHAGSFLPADAAAAGLAVTKGVTGMIEHLDTVYNDAEGWSELASAYEKLGMYQQSLSCLSDLILLEPTNTFHILRHAETAYTIGDYPMAYRGFLRALEMAGPMVDGGLGRRAAFGVKLCIKRLNGINASSDTLAAGGTESNSNVVASSSSSSKNSSKKNAGTSARQTQQSENSLGQLDVALPKKMKDIEAMLTQEMLVAYNRGWTDVGDRVAGHDEMKTLKLWMARRD